MHRQLTEALVPLLDARDLPDRIKARITSSFSFCTCSYAAVSYGLRASGSGVIANLSASAFRSSLRNFSFQPSKMETQQNGNGSSYPELWESSARHWAAVESRVKPGSPLFLSSMTYR